MADVTTVDLPGAADNQAMDDRALAALLSQHEMRAVGYYTSDIAEEQAASINAYYGRAYGDEREGRSSVVDHQVAITIDNALAALLKPFVSTADVVLFEPRQPEDEEAAKQATETVNYVFLNDNPGFRILHDWFKDALLTKIGIVKYWWDDQTRNEVANQIVDPEQLLMLRETEQYLGEADNGDGTFTVQFAQTVPDGRVVVRTIPPEEFLISPLSRSIEEAPYVAHRPSNMTRSDVLLMGFDPEVVDGLSAYAQGKNEESRSQARYEDEEWTNGTRVNATSDRSQDILGFLDEYIRCDFNGDGIAELRHVMRVGDTILLNEELDENEQAPFALLCPIPMPHKVYGLSLADQTMDLQRINTVVKRQTLDNLYLTNNPRPVVEEGAASPDTWDDLGDDAPGAGIRVRQIGGLTWATVPFAADKSFPMLSILGEEAEARTGIRRGGNGLDRNSLNTSREMTALQAAQIEAKENERVEMIARIFAETGVTRLFKGIYQLLVKFQPKARTIRLRNKWVEVDPRNWPEMDVRPSVGLGMGNRNEQMAQADSLLETMAQVIQSPYGYLVSVENAYNAIKRKIEATGVKDVEQYVTAPEQAQAPEPQPSPDVIKAQAEAQNNAAKLELERQKAAAQMEIASEKNAFDLQQQRERAALEAELAVRKMEMERDLALQKLALEAEIKSRQMSMTEDSGISSNRPGGDLSE